MLGSQAQASPKDQSHLSKSHLAKTRYFLAWRWHFYAGLYVIPFMLMLSLTGLIMLFDDEIESYRYGHLVHVEQVGHELTASAQYAAVNIGYPNAQITQYISSGEPDIANRFNVRNDDGSSTLVLVNQYTGELLGEIDRSDSWYQLANDIHGTLLIGKLGDFLIEISASLSVLLLVSGLYLWLPITPAANAGFLKIRLASGNRTLMRDLHANFGGVFSLVFLLFILSGLAWAGVWGAKMVQGWNTFPTYYTWGEKPESTLIHADLNHGSEEELPWNLELAAVPESQLHHGGNHSTVPKGEKSFPSVSLDTIIAQAQALGFERFKVFLPQTQTGVYTVAANSMAGDVTDPRKDRTTHFDQYTGDVLIDVTWADYTVIAKLMATGVSLHQGDLSIINKVFNIAFCLVFIAISITGAIMWWRRRPKQQHKLGVPPRFENDGVWKVGLMVVFAIAVCFPLAGLCIITALFLDWLVIRNNETLRAYLN